MSFYYINKFVGGYSICFAVLIGILRFKKILKTFRPFIYFLLAALLNEMISQVFTRYIGSNAINNNIYVLVEFLLLLWLFRNWDHCSKQYTFYKRIGLIISLLWFIDSFLLNTIDKFSSIYRICYSLVLIFLSINELNFLVISERKKIINNSKFIICSTLIFYFSFKALMETIFLFNLKMSTSFYAHYLLISAPVNLLANLLYTVAALWIPTKQKFTLSYQ